MEGYSGHLAGFITGHMKEIIKGWRNLVSSVSGVRTGRVVAVHEAAGEVARGDFGIVP